ncbi:MAG: MBL fold metallo-hydrolase [Nitrososphaerota archaeon]
MSARVEILVKSSVLRFSIHEGAFIYMVTDDRYTQLDGLEEYFNIDVKKTTLLDSNLGFLPVCNTVLIRSDKNVLVDPGNFHVGLYGPLKIELNKRGLGPGDIDIVVNTHCHHDHNQSNFLFRGKKLIIHKKELEMAREMYWSEYVDAFFGILDIEDSIYDGMEIAKDVKIIETPGHTPGSLSVIANTPDGLVAILGDTAMLRIDYSERKLSHWYSEEQKKLINMALDRVSSMNPAIVIPGHDEPLLFKKIKI